MNKNKDDIKRRAQFIQMSIQNPKKGADYLKLLSLGLENCRNTADTINALKQILYISEATIYRALEID